MSTNKYYPSLSTVVSLEDFPDDLGFIKKGIQEIFEKIYIKDFQANISPRGESGFYGLSIVSKDRLQFEIPGTGIYFILNPDSTNQSISSFPVTVEYQWLVLSYLRSFDLQNFSFSARDFFELGLQILNVSEAEVINLVINNFVTPSSESTTKVEQFVNDLNNQFNLTIPFPTSDNKTQELILAIKKQFSNEASIAAFLLYFLDESNIENSLNNVKSFFNFLIPQDIDAYVKNIITPKARVTLALSAAIEFPQNILKPVNSDGTAYPDPTVKSQFKFAQAQLYADTEAGIGYQMELGGSLEPKQAMIGNTGMILELDSLKLDLSKKNNIPEADADGRPNDFVGAYARAVSVTLPSRWFHDDALPNTASTSLRLGAYDLLVGTGGLSGTVILETVPVINAGEEPYYFEDKFDLIYPVILLQKNATTSKVEEVKVSNIGELKTKLFSVETTANIAPYSFKFPLSLKEKAPLTGGDKTFASPAEYQLYLNSFPNDNIVDPVPTLWKTIGSPEKGFRVGFNKFDISFKQNSIIHSDIKGAIEVPKFKTQAGLPLHVDVEGHLNDRGDFNLTASFPKGSEPEAHLFNAVDFKFNSFELGKEEEDFYLGTSCEVSFQNELMTNLLGEQKIILEKLRIYSDGNIELQGGQIPLPVNISLELGPVKMAVSNVNFGSTQINGRKYNFWGFDGAISINPLGLDARGDGVKYYYTVDDNDGPDVLEVDRRQHDSFLSIQTIEVDMIIPGDASPETAMAIIHGMISIPQPGVSEEFAGRVSLKLPQSKIAGGDIEMGFIPKYPAFYLDANIDLPAPIPLGPISISSFRGLLGYRYVASKTAVDGLTEDSKWYDYYKAPTRGISRKKFIKPPQSLEYDSPFSVGAGATFGTTADGGQVMSMRAMALMSLPTMFNIDAGMNILGKRLGPIESDPSNPPFFATVTFADNSMEMTAGANFSIPKDDGNIIKMNALLEAGFYFKNQKPWYINMGTRQNPNEAEVLTLFKAKSFIMLSAQGIEAGARLDFNLQKKFGPADVRLWAYMELGGKISFKRPQMGGYITAGGGVHIKIWIVSVDIALNTVFSVEAVKPFLIYAKLDLKVSAKVCFVKVTKSFTVELQWEKDRKIDKTPFSPLPKGTFGDKGDNRTADAVKGVHMLTNQVFSLDYFQYDDSVYNDLKFGKFDSSNPDKYEPKPELISNVIPLDTFIDIKFNKGVCPNPVLSKKIGGSISAPAPKTYTDLMPPLIEGTHGGKQLRQVKHQFGIKSIELKSWNGTSWEDYHPFEAVVEDTTTARDLVKNLPWAQWQKTTDQYDTIRVLATNPFSFLHAAEPGWHVPEQYGITPSKLFCKSKELEKEHLDFLNKNIGKRYYIPTQYEADKINGLFFKLIGESPVTFGNLKLGGDYMSITGQKNPFGFNRSLSFDNENQLEIIFPESGIEPVLNLTTLAKDVKIKAFTAVTKDNEKFVTYEAVSLKKNASDSSAVTELTYSKSELASAITLFDSEQSDPFLKTKIDKIVITPGSKDIVASPAKPSFTRYYGYKGTNTYSFENVVKFGNTYLISFHPSPNTTALIQLDANGKLLRERLLNGVVTSMQVINDKLVLTQALDPNQCKGIGSAIIDYDFVVGCEGHVAATAIVELDADLNQIFGFQYPNTYTIGYNKLFSIGNNDRLWINTLGGETQINWVAGSNHAILDSVKINAQAIKVLQHNDTVYSLITKDKKVISFSINTGTKTISRTNNVTEISNASITEISDAVLADGKMVLAVTMSEGQSGLVQLDGTNNTIVTNTVFGDGLKLSNNTLPDNSVLAYNDEYLFVFDGSLVLTKWIKREGGLTEASIINVQNEPSANEILMISAKEGEKGVYFSLFDNLFANCCLINGVAPPLSTVNVTVSGSSLNFIPVSILAGSAFKKGGRNSKLISVNDIICSNQNPEVYTTSIQEISWLTWENHLYNLSISGMEAVEEQKAAMIEAVQNTVQPVWRPNTTYYLHFILEDKVDNESKPFEYYYGFKTSGPVGHYPIPAPGEDPQPSNELLDLGKSPLTSLRQYIDYNRSYPNADGNLLQSKPVFYENGECEISLFFAHPYVYHMLKDWPQYGNRNEIKGALNLMIKDPLNDELIPYPLPTETTTYPKAKETDAQWVNDNDPRISLSLQILNKLNAQGGNCALQGGDPLKPKSYAYTVTLTDLKPNKLYTALVNNYFGDNPNTTAVDEGKNTLVHQFGFQTSRYRDFEEQVYSYKLEEKDETGAVIDTRNALFDINLNVSQDQIEALYHLVSAATTANALSDAVASKYQHAFDRAIEGVLKMSPLDPAQNTEINRIIDTNTGEIVALLIRNPEPFNIPKMPLEEIKDTISVGDIAADTGMFTKKSEFNTLHSKDYAQVLIMNTSKNIPTGNTGLRFEYRMWNNNSEVIGGVVPVTKMEKQVLLPVIL